MRRFVATVGLAVVTNLLLSDQAAAEAGRWRPSGPAGFVNFITQDPGPAGTVYATGVATGAGVFKSRDHGDTWELITTFQVDVLVVDPGNPTTLYGSSSIPERGVFKSNDSGRTWARSSTGLPPFAWLLLYAAGPGHVYGVGPGVWETRDGASTWHPASSGMFGIRAFGIDPTNVRRVYASDQYGYIFRSNDGGENWIRATGSGHPKTAIAVDPSVPNHVYAGATCCQNIWASADFGETWTELPGPASGVLSVLVDGAGRILAGTRAGPCSIICPPEPTGVFRSDDYAATWEPLNEGLGYRSIRQLLLVSNGRRLVALTGGDPGTFVYDFALIADVPGLSDLSKFIFGCLLAFAGLLAVRRL